MKQNWKPLLFFLLLIGLVVALVYLSPRVFHIKESEKLLHVDYLDVGQGDSIFVESPKGVQVLIDGGRDGVVLRRLSSVMGYFDRTIDLVVATHPDADHIGGLIDVLKRYNVKTILMTKNVNDTPAYESFLAAVNVEGATIVNAERGERIDLGVGDAGSTTIQILFPDRDVTNLESNTSSIILKLSYGDADFLFTGDSPRNIETYLVALDPEELQSEVLKVGHHGSRTSTDPLFLAAVRPQYAIISAGKDNEYGHPHKEVMDELEAAHVSTKNTADVGSIFMSTNGKDIWVK